MNTASMRRGLAAGFAGGAVTLAVMYLLGGLAGVQPLPQALQEPILAAMPGPVFGFLIDNLQHLGKVLEEAGLILTLLAAFSLLGGVYGALRARGGVPMLGLLVAGGAWLVIVAVFLPLGGEGFLGLGESIQTPVVWALFLTVYAIVLQFIYERQPGSGPAEAADPGRRRLLGLVPIGVGLVALGALGARLFPGWYEAVARPPESAAGGPSSELTRPENFYLVSKNFDDPVVSASGWSLNIHGLVDKPLRLDYQALRALKPRDELITLSCISNNVGGALISTGRFTGVSLVDLLAMAQPQARASWLAFKARDGFTESLPLETVNASPEILVAWDLDGAPLTSRHGFPARVLIPGRYGMKQPKWLEDIELTNADHGGYWEGQGWDNKALVKTMSRFDTPRDGFILPLRAIHLAGVAYAGTRGIQRVEFSSDGGRNWSPVSLRPPLSPFTWVLWEADWTPSREGAHQLMVRAADGRGETQTADTRPSYPNGASGYHTIRVSVARR